MSKLDLKSFLATAALTTALWTTGAGAKSTDHIASQTTQKVVALVEEDPLPPVIMDILRQNAERERWDNYMKLIYLLGGMVWVWTWGVALTRILRWWSNRGRPISASVQEYTPQNEEQKLIDNYTQKYVRENQLDWWNRLSNMRKKFIMEVWPEWIHSEVRQGRIWDCSIQASLYALKIHPLAYTIVWEKMLLRKADWTYIIAYFPSNKFANQRNIIVNLSGEKTEFLNENNYIWSQWDKILTRALMSLRNTEKINGGGKANGPTDMPIWEIGPGIPSYWFESDTLWALRSFFWYDTIQEYKTLSRWKNGVSAWCFRIKNAELENVEWLDTGHAYTIVSVDNDKWTVEIANPHDTSKPIIKWIRTLEWIVGIWIYYWEVYS